MHEHHQLSECTYFTLLSIGYIAKACFDVIISSGFYYSPCSAEMSEDSAISSAPDDIQPQLEDEEEMVTYTAEPSNVSVDKLRVSEVELIADEQDLTASRNTESRNSSHSASRILKANSKPNMDMEDGVQEVAEKTYTKLKQNIILGVMISFVIGIFSVPIILYYTDDGGTDNVMDEFPVTNCRDMVGHISHLYRD